MDEQPAPSPPVMTHRRETTSVDAAPAPNEPELRLPDSNHRDSGQWPRGPGGPEGEREGFRTFIDLSAKDFDRWVQWIRDSCFVFNF